MEFNFSQNQTVESLDTVPESFRGAYEQGGDGKFAIRQDVVGLVTAFDGVSGALKKERGIAGDLRKQKDVGSALKETLGFDSLDSAKARFDELTAAVAAKANVDPAKIRNEIEATFQTERDGFKTALSSMESTLAEHLIGNTAKSALAAHKGNELFLMPHIERSAKVVKDDTSGKYVVRVVDADGQFRGDGKGGFMGVEDLVSELKANKLFAGAFESEAPGGGTTRAITPPASRGAVRQQQQRDTKQGNSPVDKIAGGLAKLQRA